MSDGTTTTTLAPMPVSATEATGTTGTTGASGVTPTLRDASAPILVTISSAHLEYGIFTMANGDVLALPEYVYDGAEPGATYTMSFRVIPIAPQYLDLRGVTNGA